MHAFFFHQQFVIHIFLKETNFFIVYNKINMPYFWCSTVKLHLFSKTTYFNELVR